MEKKRLKLNELKVQSFRTSLDSADSETLKGGAGAPTNYSDCGTGAETIICCGVGNSANPVCASQVAACQNTQADVCVVFIRTIIGPDGNNICF